jgi:hypothetical protein
MQNPDHSPPEPAHLNPNLSLNRQKPARTPPPPPGDMPDVEALKPISFLGPLARMVDRDAQVWKQQWRKNQRYLLIRLVDLVGVGRVGGALSGRVCERAIWDLPLPESPQRPPARWRYAARFAVRLR